MSIINEKNFNKMKKLKLNFKLILATCVFSIIIIACSSNIDGDNGVNNSKIETLNIENFSKNSNMSLNYINEKHYIKFTSELINNKINSTSEVFDKNTNELIKSTTFVLDKNLPSYKLGVFKNIEEISSDIKASLTKNDWVKIKNSYERFVKELLKEIDSEMHKSDLIQSAFYHLSIFNTVIRSYDIEDCECTPLPAYFVGKSSFWCQEDYMFDINQMMNYFKTNKNQLFEFKDGEKVYEYVKKLDSKNEYISYKELFELRYSVKTYKDAILQNNNTNLLNKDREDCWLGILGSDLGCCGNYSGCCWVATVDCFLHDVECMNCDHWHCGWACEPGFTP